MPGAGGTGGAGPWVTLTVTVLEHYAVHIAHVYLTVNIRYVKFPVMCLF